MCVAWSRGEKFGMVIPDDDSGEGEGEDNCEYVSPEARAGCHHYLAIREVSKPFGDGDQALAAYCDWSAANGPALVAEFAKRV